LGIGNLHKRRNRTIECVSDGAKQLDFPFLDQSIRTDDLHTRFEHIPSDLRRGQREAVLCGIQLL